MKRRRVEKNKVSSFDLEKWFRWALNGAAGYKLGAHRTICNPDGRIIGYYGDGGRVERFTDSKDIGGLESVVRFSLYPGVSMETLTHHHWKQTMIAKIMLDIEMKYGNPFNLRQKLLDVAFTHDLSEILGTDINYHVKNKDQKSKAAYKRKDLAMHKQAVAGLRPEWRAYFPPPPDVNDDFPETERRFWEACELVGYCLFMLEEIDLGNICAEHIVRFYSDVSGYISRLGGMEDEWASVDEMLFWEIMPKFTRLQKKVSRAKNKLAAKNG